MLPFFFLLPKPMVSNNVEVALPLVLPIIIAIPTLLTHELFA